MKTDSEKIILYLSKNFRKKIKLEDLSRLVGQSPFHFHRNFVKENNCTPQIILENIRMQHAKHIMTIYPSWSMTEVAFECGYSSPGIFSRAFKNFFKIPPSKFVPKEIIIPEKFEKREPLKIQYLTKKILSIKKVPLDDQKINHLVERMKKRTIPQNIIYGVFLDVPFHVPQEKCRYFLGIEDSNNLNPASTFTFPAGFYTSIIMIGDFDELGEKLGATNNHIMRNGYIIDSLVGFEKINISSDPISFDYYNTNREILIKIKRE